jgi:hypothetical protein
MGQVAVAELLSTVTARVSHQHAFVRCVGLTPLWFFIASVVCFTCNALGLDPVPELHVGLCKRDLKDVTIALFDPLQLDKSVEGDIVVEAI